MLHRIIAGLLPPPDHGRLLCSQPVKLRPDRDNVIADLAPVDVKVDARVIGGGHAIFKENKDAQQHLKRTYYLI